MKNCVITGNKGGRGGGVYVNSENDKVNLFENCTIANTETFIERYAGFPVRVAQLSRRPTGSLCQPLVRGCFPTAVVVHSG